MDNHPHSDRPKRRLTDEQILRHLEAGLPLVPRPFAEVARRLDCDERELLHRLNVLRGANGPIRTITGIFRPEAVGYTQTLVAMDLPPEKLDAAGAEAARHPGVSHAYGRTGELNLWFTLAVSPQSRLGVDRTVKLLGGRCGAKRALSLPAVRTYKLHVRFAPGAGGLPEPPARPSAGTEPSADQRLAIRALQEELPARPEPFTPLAEAVGLDSDSLLVHAADFLAAGWMRRYAALLDHRSLGMRGNVLVAWQVDPERVDQLGAACAASEAVSHCYLRQTGPEWAYNLYTMLHARDRNEAGEAVRTLAARIGSPPHCLLWTRREYKKTRVRLFSGQEQRWEQRNAI